MKYKGEKGNVIIEASIVMTITIVMVAVLLNLGIMLYNRNLMQTAATDAAINVANVYANTYRDPIYGYMDDTEFYNTELYRYLVDIFTSSHKDAAIQKATWYAKYSLKRHQIATIDDLDVNVQVVRKPGALIQRQVVVTLEANFEVPLAAVWGGNNKATYVVEGRADCIDLLDYFNTVGTVNETILSKLDKFLDPVKKIISIFDLSSLEG